MTEPQQQGWYPDYTTPGTERWHDGQQWTQATRAAGSGSEVALGDAQGQMDTNDLPAGQKVRGVIAFKVPAGQTLSEVILSGPLGDQLALWHL